MVMRWRLGTADLDSEGSGGNMGGSERDVRIRVYVCMTVFQLLSSCSS